MLIMPIMLSMRPAVVVASLFLLAAAPAFAQGTAQERSACEGDAFKFCSHDIPNIPKIEACLENNMSKLTPACQEEFREQSARHTKLTPEHFNNN
jgi:hypothetical protein